MRYLLLVLLLAGCSTTVPVVMKFPDPPKYTEKCPPLEQLKDGAKLSDVATTVNDNYTLYYECAVKNDAWIEWYQEQKQIFESVK
jgi:hypothetical protein